METGVLGLQASRGSSSRRRTACKTVASLWVLVLVATFVFDSYDPADAQQQTKFLKLGTSMDKLLADGYQVVSIGVGLSGFAYLLKQKDRYVTCAVQPDRSRSDVYVSECRAMN